MCSNWNIENLNELDYNGMFEYLYGMKYGEKFNSEDYPNGIPKEEFESLIMEYLPITAEQIRDYAVFDEENQTYYWVRLGCFNYAPTFFGTSLPEVIDIKENEDGTKQYVIEANGDTDLRKVIFSEFAKENITIFEMKKADITLEDAFMQLIEGGEK